MIPGSYSIFLALVSSIQGGLVRNILAGGLAGDTIDQARITLSSNLESDSSEMDKTSAKGDVKVIS